MKFKKLYILPVLALGLAACSNEDEGLFDQSAAERLDAGQKEYFSTLCADGGMWTMEYFSNTEEPGYLFVMNFHDDKSVDIHTDHKWIGSTYKTEKSLWDVINDDGNVLTFNSYNTIFHIFSTPENIEGPDAPVDASGKDVDELGYGHDGDYEFMLMENGEDYIRMLGKKRGYYIYLRRLPADTDPEAYLSEVAAIRTAMSNKKFPTFVMTETATESIYDVTGLGSDVVSIMPHNSGNPFGQTETQACIITKAGLRPLKAFDCIRRDDSHFTIDEFTWADDGSLVAPGVRITAQAPATSLKDATKTWLLDKTSMSADLEAAHTAANEDLMANVGKKYDLRNVDFGYNSDGGKTYFAITTHVGTRLCRDFYELTTNDANHVTITLVSSNKASTDTGAKAPKYVEFKNMLAGEFALANIAPMNPNVITFTSNSATSFKITVQ